VALAGHLHGQHVTIHAQSPCGNGRLLAGLAAISPAAIVCGHNDTLLTGKVGNPKAIGRHLMSGLAVA